MDPALNTTRFRLARILLVLSVLAAGLVWFLPFDALGPNGWEIDPAPTRGAWPNLCACVTELFEMIPCNLIARNFNLICGAAASILALTMLAAPICIELLTRASLLKWLWLCADAGIVVGLAAGWDDGKYRYFITGIPPYVHDVHTHFLIGFWVACAAALLHFAGLILIPSIRPARSDHKIPA